MWWYICGYVLRMHRSVHVCCKCLCKSVYVCMYVCMYVCISVCIISAWVYVCPMNVCLGMCIKYVCMCVYVYGCMFVWVHGLGCVLQRSDPFAEIRTRCRRLEFVFADDLIRWRFKNWPIGWFGDSYQFVQWRPDGDSVPKPCHFMWVFVYWSISISAFYLNVSCACIYYSVHVGHYCNIVMLWYYFIDISLLCYQQYCRSVSLF